MLVGFDTEYSFGRILELPGGRAHCDHTSMNAVCACLFFEDGRELRVTENWQQLQKYFDDPQYEFVVHGAHAEAAFCELAGLRFPKRYFDTLLMSVLLQHVESFNNRRVYSSSSLVEMCARYHLPFITGSEKDDIRDSIMRGTHVEQFGMDHVLDYCMGDCKAVVQLYPLLRAEVAKRCGSNAFINLANLYQPYSLLMARAVRRGIRFDRDGWARLMELAPVYRERQLSVMRVYDYQYGGTGLSDNGFRKMLSNIGLASTWPRTETGRMSQTVDDIKDARHLHVTLEATYKLLNFDSFMGQDMGSLVDGDGRIRCGILVLSQHSGRNSTISPNLMGIPGELRPLLLPEEGCKWIHFDYSQQEPGIAGFLSGCTALIEDFSGDDVYIGLGKRLGLIKSTMGKTQVKHIRKTILKSLMLAILYGKSIQSIARDLGCSRHEAALHLSNFQQTYQQLFDWLMAQVAGSMERGWAQNIIGFRSAFNASTAKERGHVVRSCQNFPIQSSAAACFQLTGLYLADQDIRLPIHDAYLINVPNEPDSIQLTRARVLEATSMAVGQLFPGLPARCDIEELQRFAKDGAEDSFEVLVNSLEARA